MKKTVFTLLVLAAALALPGGERLFKYLPSGAEYTVGVDTKTLQKQPFFLELKKNPNFNSLLGEGFERNYGVKLEECEKLIFAGGGKKLRATLALTTLPEAELKTRLKALGERFSTESEGGRELYCLISDDSIPSTRITLSLAYLEKDLVLVTEREYVKPYYAALVAPEAERRAAYTLPAGNPLAWSHIDFKKIFSGKKNKQAAMFFNGVQNAYLELNLAGKGWNITGDALCRNESSALQFAMLLPAYLQIASGWLFSGNPALGQEFLKEVKIYPEGNRTKLRLDVSEELGKKLAEHLRQQGQQLIAPPDKVPDALKPADGGGTVSN